jgi:hypothetical protein
MLAHQFNPNARGATRLVIFEHLIGAAQLKQQAG